MKKFTLVLVLLLISGCLTPSADQIKSNIVDFKIPQEPYSNKAIIYVIRPSYFGFITGFNIFIDGKEIGYTRAGEYIYFEVEPGKHQLMSKAENISQYDFIAHSADVLFFRQEARLGMLLARNELSMLDDLSGKYYLKNTSLGVIYSQKIKKI